MRGYADNKRIILVQIAPQRASIGRYMETDLTGFGNLPGRFARVSGCAQAVI
jgi:hypothetical protein